MAILNVRGAMRKVLVKKDCPICKAFAAEQKQKLATPIYRERKNEEHGKETVTAPCYVYPTLVHAKDYSLLGWVEQVGSLKRPLLARR